MLISAAHYLGNTPRCGIAQPQCSIESREQINCNCDENLPCEGKTWIGIRHELGRIWPILVNKDETANINDGSLTQFFKGKYNWESADGSELTNLCLSVRGWKNLRPLSGDEKWQSLWGDEKMLGLERAGSMSGPILKWHRKPGLASVWLR